MIRTKRLLCGIAGVLLGLMSAFFAFVTADVTADEVMPAVRNGSLNVETVSMILNVRWEGNAIYILLTAYVLAAAGCAWGAFRLLKKAVSGA